MDSRVRIWPTGLFILAMTYGGAAGAGAAPQQEVRDLTVAVAHYADVDPKTMKEAERVASEVYRRAGIEIQWVEPSTYEGATRLYVNVLSQEMAAPYYASDETVGFAIPGSRAANVIYERIRQAARRRHVASGLLLGYVIAHELGHLLLPAHSHSSSGLMRPDIDMKLAATKKLRFTAHQVALIQERLTVQSVVSTQ
jgi:hypothetical protein